MRAATEPAAGMAVRSGTAGWASLLAPPRSDLFVGNAAYLAVSVDADADLDFLCEGVAGRVGLVVTVGGVAAGVGLTRRQALALSAFLAARAALLPDESGTTGEGEPCSAC